MSNAKLIAKCLSNMECLELHNCWLPSREVFWKGKKTEWRNQNLDHLLELGLIVEGDPEHFYYTKPEGRVFKAYRTTLFGDEVLAYVMPRALKTIERFRKRRER